MSVIFCPVRKRVPDLIRGEFAKHVTVAAVQEGCAKLYFSSRGAGRGYAAIDGAVLQKLENLKPCHKFIRKRFLALSGSEC